MFGKMAVVQVSRYGYHHIIRYRFGPLQEWRIKNGESRSSRLFLVILINEQMQLQNAQCWIQVRKGLSRGRPRRRGPARDQHIKAKYRLYRPKGII